MLAAARKLVSCSIGSSAPSLALLSASSRSCASRMHTEAAPAWTAVASPTKRYGGLVTLSAMSVNGQLSGVYKITLNNADKLNMLTEDMGNEFSAVCEELRAGGGSAAGPPVSDLRCVILTGSGRAFSSGGDLDFLEARCNSEALVNAETMLRFYKRYLSVRTIPVPVIAAINGPAIGAGLCLAMATDVRIASPKAKMGLTFVNIGLHPGMAGSFFLPKLVGQQQAARMIFTGEVVDGAEAQRIGLVAECAEDPVGRAVAMSLKIAKASPQAVRASTRTLRAHLDHGLEEGLLLEAGAQAHNYSSADLREGVQALRAKREPVFGHVYRGPK